MPRRRCGGGRKKLESLSYRAPLTIFGDWLNDAMAAEKINPNAMTLATVGDDGMPQARSVLLKSFDENGFVFYANRKSRKGQALLSRPLAALLFYWRPLARQVLIEGRTRELSRAEVECYFNTRPRDSRIGAWASEQSRPMKNLAAYKPLLRPPKRVCRERAAVAAGMERFLFVAVTHRVLA